MKSFTKDRDDMRFSWKSWALMTALLAVPLFVPALSHVWGLTAAAKSLGHIEY